MTVELVPGGTGEPIELGRAIIANDGSGDYDTGHYYANFWGKPRYKHVLYSSTLRGFKRQQFNVWYLLCHLLQNALGEKLKGAVRAE